MKLQKMQFRQTLLILSSILLISIFVVGCSKEKETYTYSNFIELCGESFSLESPYQESMEKLGLLEQNNLNQAISIEEAKNILEGLAETTIDFSKYTGEMTETKAKEMVEAALNAYLNQEDESVEIVEYQDDVIDERNQAVYQDENIFEIPDHQLSVGDIILVLEDGETKAKRVIDIDGNLIYTQEAKIDEVISNLEIDEDIELDQSDVELEEGVSVATSSLSTRAKHNLNLSLKLNFKSGEISLSSDFGKMLGMSQSLELGTDLGTLDHLSLIPSSFYSKNSFKTSEYIQSYLDQQISISELKQKLNVNKVQDISDSSFLSSKFTSGYEIYGNLGISNLSIHPSFTIKDGIIQNLSVDLNYTMETKLTFKGKVGESIKLGTIHTPIGSTGVILDFDLYLCFNANGSATLKIEHANHVKAEYINGTYKRVNAQSTNVSANAALKLTAGPQFDMMVSFLGINITDVNLNMAAELKPAATIALETDYEENEQSMDIHYTTYLNLSTNVYAPIITMKLGTKDSLAKRLGISMEWKILKEGDVYTYEIYSNRIPIYEGKDFIELTKDIINGTIEVEPYYLCLNVGQCNELSITDLPDGYTLEDLMIYVEDPTIASIDGYTITGLSPGDTEVVIQTKDELYKTKCAIHIIYETKEEFTGL